MRLMARRALIWVLFTAAFVVLAWLCIFTGTVDIPFADICSVLGGGEASKEAWTHIIYELRLPSAVTAALTGASLGVAGLLLQTTFNNPLAGPSVLGVSTGASLGVAVLLLAAPAFVSMTASAIIGAVIGSAFVLLLLLLMSSMVRSAVMLLIIGLMLSYLGSSAISLLNFYATQEGVHSYVIWGMGNFSSVGSAMLPTYAVLTAVLCVAVFPMCKSLNAMLLGERYAENVGTNVTACRNIVLAIAGALIAVTTAFCGPIGFIGLAIPHISRLLWQTSNHKLLLPAVIMTGAVTGLLTLWVSMLPGERGVLPVNAITPIIGVPVVLYIILNRRKISYFN